VPSTMSALARRPCSCSVLAVVRELVGDPVRGVVTTSLGFARGEHVGHVSDGVWLVEVEVRGSPRRLDVERP
jgi:hypothetical protein